MNLILSNELAKAFAWMGGGAFVASIGAFWWWYLVALGHPHEAAETLMPLACDAALVGVFATHHSIFARQSIKRRLSVRLPGLERSLYVWVASLLLILLILLWQPVGGVLYESSRSMAWVHAAVQIAGGWLIARAVSGLDPLELAGIRQAAGTPPKPEALQIRGPYRWVRHPLYLGWVVALFGAARMTGDRLAIAGLTSLYLVIAVPWEERSLMQSFGPDYTQYRKQVRWRMIPFVY